MKIVCDACQAKYSISDDKVQGKVFKIRCKKCSNIIVVRGGAGAAEAAPAPQEKDTRVYDYGYDGGGGEAPAGDDAVWHLVINQDQVGPLTVAEVQQRFASGEVDGETFTWREGFADWLPLAQVDAFAALVASGTTTAALGGGGAAAVGAMFGAGDDLGSGTMKSDPGDLFAAASSGSARGRDHHDDDGGDLFGSKPAASAQSASAAGSKMRGERNENSVLFSLNNLAQLASDKPAHHAPSSSSSSSSSGHATGAAGGEGSGLIDIRSMASAYLGGGGAATSKPASAGIGSIDDLPVFGGGGFSEPAVIVPTARPSGNSKVLYVMIAAVGLLAVVAVIMVVMLMKSKDKPATVVAAAPADTAKPATDTGSAAPDKVAAPATDTAAKPATDTGSANGSSTQVATADTAKTDTKADTAKTDTKAAPSHTTTAPTHTTTAPAHTTTTPSHAGTATVAHTDTAPAHTTAPPAADSGGCDEVSCVLNNYDGACCAKFKKKGAGGGGGGGGAATGGGGGAHSDLPDALDRSMISAGIANVKARVTSCGDKSSAKGKVKVHVKVGGDGRVSGVNVETSPDAALGACVAAAVQKASFGKTQNGGSFSYPFVF